MRIINSILDNDLYKFTQQNAAIMLFPNLKVRYKFIDRSDLIYPKGFADKLRNEIQKMSSLKLNKDEKNFMLNKCPFLSPSYLIFLSGYEFNPDEVNVFQDTDGHLSVHIEGLWTTTILWEVPILSIISELYFIETGQIVDINTEEFTQRNINKVELFKKHNAYFGDMGTRRRYSFNNHLKVLKDFKKNSNHTFVGTSNVYMGFLLDLPIIGTVAHETMMVHAAIYGYKMANKISMENWVSVFHGDLGTMLSDTFTTDEFLKSFTKKYSKLYDGIRHDSGCPFKFVDKVVSHYNKMGINPMFKYIIFSDGLTPKLSIEIKEYCVDKIMSSFGLGTNFSNDVGVIPLKIVIKISEVYIDGRWVPAVKLSDDEGKNTGIKSEVKLCKQILNLN